MRCCLSTTCGVVKIRMKRILKGLLFFVVSSFLGNLLNFFVFFFWIYLKILQKRAEGIEIVWKWKLSMKMCLLYLYIHLSLLFFQNFVSRGNEEKERTIILSIITGKIIFIWIFPDDSSQISIRSDGCETMWHVGGNEEEHGTVL